jgi:hypothetical protein
MTPDVERRRAREEIILGRTNCARYRSFERRLHFDHQLLSLCRADGHASGRGSDGRGQQAVGIREQQLALWQFEEPPRRADHERVMWRVDCQ